MSAGTQAGLASAWVALQIVRVMFLPFIIIGLGIRIAERRSQQAKAGSQRFYAKPLSSSTDI